LIHFYKRRMQTCLALMAMAVLVAGEDFTEGDFCNNGCGNSTESWCNKRRTASDGTVMYCREKTRYGGYCMNGCKKGSEDHYWCWIAWHSDSSWEYCGLEGQTRYGVRCIGECARKGEDYWWCYTEYDRYDSSKGTKWEYCSPPGQVKRVVYTTHGQECIGDCTNQGKNYWWCRKSMRWRGNGGRGGRTRDDNWDYCSPQSSTGKARTRYDKPCKNACASRGENYFWCDTWDDTWEYCSPKAEAQQVVVRKGQQIYPCAGICDKRDDEYKWCTVVSVSDAKIKSYWNEAQNFHCGKERMWGEEEEESGMSGWLIAFIVLLCFLVVGFCIKRFFCQ